MDCLPQIHACAMRVTRLNAAGESDIGASNMYVTDALITMNLAPQIEEGEEITMKNGCGKIVVGYKAASSLKRLGVELNLATPDPELHELLTGGKVLSYSGRTGFGFPALGELFSENGISLELWTHRVDESGDTDPDLPFARWVFPRVKLGIGNREFGNKALENPLSGFAIENANWGTGPVADWPTDSDRVAQWLPMPLSDYPDVDCGYQEVPDLGS